jgi:hypothetical protein
MVLLRLAAQSLIAKRPGPIAIYRAELPFQWRKQFGDGGGGRLVRLSGWWLA